MPGGGPNVEMTPPPLGLICYCKLLGRPRANSYYIGPGPFKGPIGRGQEGRKVPAAYNSK